MKKFREARKYWKKLLVAAPMLSTFVLAGCIGVSLQDYSPPVYEVKAEQITWDQAAIELPVSEEETSDSSIKKTEEKDTEKKQTPVGTGSFDLEDGTYRGVGEGYAGKITVSVQIKDKTITDITVVNVEADDDAFFNRAKGVIDKIICSQKLDVDVISGATYSSRGIINAVKNALTGEKDTNTAPAGSSSQNTSRTSKPSTLATVQDPAAYKDGTYYGSGTGFAGPITVKVVVKNGKISTIDITQHSDGSSYIQQASSILSNIVSSQSTNVDTVSGATYSSVGIIEAVRDALSQAAVTNNNSSTKNENNRRNDENTNNKTGTKIPTGKFPYKDGVYYGTGEGYMGDITVAVVIQDKTIKYILITDVEGDDKAYIDRAKAVLNRVISKQKLKVDVVSGATFSSNGILEAIKEAIAEAKKATKGEPTPTPTETPTPTPEPTITETPAPDDDDSEPTPTPTLTETPTPSIFVDGEYMVEVPCLPDKYEDFEEYTLSLKVTIKDDVIQSITDIAGGGPLYIDENINYITKAANGTKRRPGVVTQILEKNSTEDIDAVSGATCSSKSIIDACAQALNNARR